MDGYYPDEAPMPASIGAPVAGFPPDPMAMGPMGMGMDPYGSMPPPMDPMGMPVDPMSMGMDPMMMESPLLGAMTPVAAPMEPPEAEPPPGPDLSSKLWYRKPSRPNATEITTEAEQERFAHGGRIAIAMEMIRRLSLDTFGYFSKDEEKVSKGEIPPTYSNQLRAEHDMACAHIAGMDWGVEALYREVIEKEEAATKEDLASYLFECEQRQHSRAGNASIKWALPDILQKYGMLVGFDAIDPSDDECGLRMRLVDPATVFPIFEGHRGLRCVYRIYTNTASSIVGDFGDAAGSVERKVKAIAKAEANRYDPTFMGEVIEYWDRNWVMVLYEGKPILVREHGYARVPFTITYGCFGQQAFTRSTDNYFVDASGKTVVVTAGVGQARQRYEDLMRTAQPFLYWRVKTHDTEEAISGLMIQALRRAINTPIVHKRSIMSQGQGAVKVGREEAGYTQVFEDDAFEPFPSIPSPEIMGPLQMYIQQNRMMGAPSGVLSGQPMGAQTSGSALDISTSIGYERWNPLIMVIQQFLAERTEWRMELIRDWGSVLGDPDDLGTMPIPRRNRNPRTGNAAAHKVTPKLLRDTGIRMTVELRRFNPATLSQVANGLMILFNMGIIDKRTMIKIAGFSPDPDAIMQAIDFDDLNAVPEVKQEKTLRLLARLRDQALMREDWESAIDLEQALYFIASEMERRATIGQPALGPDGQRMKPLGPGGGGNAGSPVQFQGASMPMMGVDTGTNGGRPQGT